jgi:hypothetical protein
MALAVPPSSSATLAGGSDFRRLQFTTTLTFEASRP